MFRIKFPTKCIFRIFLISKINGMAPFCKLIKGTTLVPLHNRNCQANLYLQHFLNRCDILTKRDLSNYMYHTRLHKHSII